ncbi:unnamed protein product [Peronospora farinosa]|uniref:Crinkler effector protein N-terminal domain-containing protein n=1 Tax=Peronospora farinosa TaxID=134698 RepID=A0AAV0SSG0_9STRA|nr:unnamed protein product [Peronospora farinosa]CAI5704685.1 unnamed protein product [Peronospora farinosa]
MLTLFCAIVGTKGSVFSVDIDANRSVYDLKKEMKAKKLYHFPSDQFQLFVAKMTDGNWLKDDAPAALELKEGKKHKDIQTVVGGEKMDVTRTLQYWLFEKNKMPQPSTGQVHVLVIASKDFFKWKSRLLRPHTYDPESKYFWLKKEDTLPGVLSERMMLYCRPNFHEQVEFLRERVLKEGHQGWILGPSGTGKSSTATVFALTVDRNEWEVIWIDVALNPYCRCVRLIGDERMSRTIDNAKELEDVLQVDDNSKHRVVLVDGWTDEDDLSNIAKIFNRHFDLLTRAMEYLVYSWTLDEYLAATSDDMLFRVVEPYLGDSVSDRSAMVKAKYFYAGRSCRYMFCYNSTDVVNKLHVALDSQSNYSCLFAMFKTSAFIGVVKPVISRFAAMVIGVTWGPNKINDIMYPLNDYSNSALNGWMFELKFFASIRNGDLEIVDAAGNIHEKWSRSEVLKVDGIPHYLYLCRNPVWIMPQKWNEGGYDAIMSDQSFEIKTLEIVFVVERRKLNGFKFSTVTGEGLLEPFGWQKFTEAGRAKKVGFRGLLM